MALTKKCEHCGAEFEKPYYCGMPAWGRRKFCSLKCKAAAQIGHIPGNKGHKSESRAKKLPCRICGNPTKYHGTEKSHLFGLVHCGSNECADESRRIKNENISLRHKYDYESGKRRKIRNTWASVSRISQEEQLISDKMRDRGFQPQYKILTGESSVKMPRCFWLDFAIPDRKICVEIDGTIHRLRKERDARKDAMLMERGWKVLRLPSSSIISDVETTLHQIDTFIASS